MPTKKDKNTVQEANVQKHDGNTRELTHDKPIYTPATDIYEGESDIMLYADMPGVCEKDIEVTLEDDVLTLVGHQNTEAPENMELLYNGYRPGIYRRTFIIGKAVDREKVKACIRDGVLTLTLPKAEEAKPKKIAVSAG